MPPGKSSLIIWGVVYVSDIKPRVVANFSQEFVQQEKSKRMKINLLASDEEIYFTNTIRMNIALKYSSREDCISVILFKSILEVQIIVIEKSNMRYIFYSRGYS